MFESKLEELKTKWSSHVTHIASITADQREWPLALDNTRVILGEIKNLVYLVENSKELGEWVAFLTQVLKKIHNLEVHAPMWRVPKSDLSGAPYDYSAELARDIIHILHFLFNIGLLENKLVSQLAWLLDESGKNLEPTLRYMVFTEIAMDWGQELDFALLGLSESCERIGRHDRASVVASRAFWHSISKIKLGYATICLRVAITNGGVKPIFAALVKKLITVYHAARLKPLAKKSGITLEVQNIAYQLLNLLVVQR